MSDPTSDSFRKLIHDLNQVVFLIRGHCDLAQLQSSDSDSLKYHLQQVELCLRDFEKIYTQLKRKQLELAPEE